MGLNPTKILGEFFSRCIMRIDHEKAIPHKYTAITLMNKKYNYNIVKCSKSSKCPPNKKKTREVTKTDCWTTQVLSGATIMAQLIVAYQHYGFVQKE